MSVLPAPSIQLARSLAVGVDELPALSAFQLFSSQMESSSMEASSDAMKRLAVVAVAMGTDDARSKLVPYLTTLANKQPPMADEILLLLGQELIPVADWLGPASTLELVPIVERLASVEETVVRDQAVKVVEYLCERGQLDNATIASLSAMAKRLSAADWFTAKVSAAGMIAPILALQLSPELLNIYRDLAHDDTPMVRRSAAKHLGKVLKQSGLKHRDFATSTLPGLMTDEQDSVRLLAAASLADVGSDYGKDPAWTIQHWLPLVKDASTDMSWYVFDHGVVGTLQCVVGGITHLRHLSL